MLPPNLRVRHIENSFLLSADDDLSVPSKFLIDLSLEAIKIAQTLDLSWICQRMSAEPFYPNVWPGEHYKLLAGFVKAIEPKLIIEIGTSTGLSALALKDALPKNSKIVTYDIFNWQNYANTVLKREDFEDGKLQQRVIDLTESENIIGEHNLLAKADLIFIDAAKDGSCEFGIMNSLRKVNFEKKPLLLFDDIRLKNMIVFWRSVTAPKLDLTSFGHWSGTGLVEGLW